MTKAGIAELKNSLSRYIAFVRTGGEVIVLDRDTPVARIIPFAAQPEEGRAAGRTDNRLDDERLAEMERQGVIKQGDAGVALEWEKVHPPVRLGPRSGSVVETLLEMRREDAR